MKKKKLPKFKSHAQEARFWALHSPLDYEDEFKESESLEFSKRLKKKVVKKSRKEWVKDFESMHANGDDKLLMDDNLDLEIDN